MDKYESPDRRSSSTPPLTTREKEVLATLEDELRADDATLTTRPWPSARAASQPRGWLREELAAEWHGFSPAIRTFFYLLPVGLVFTVVGGVVGSPWMMMLGTVAFLSATGCTVYEARARRKAP